MIKTHLSFQKFLSSSIVLAAPRMRAKRTSTPESLSPQNALQKSRDRFCEPGELALAYFDNDVVEACRLAVILNNLLTQS
jgi:hypothetical protein